MVKFARNGDLNVQHTRAFQPSQTGPAHTVNFMAFKESIDMILWQAAAFASYGDDRCAADNIDNLTDLFSEEFHQAFNKRLRFLLLVERRTEFERRRDELSAHIEALNRAILREGYATMLERSLFG